MSYSSFPNRPTIPITPFKVNISTRDIDHLKQLLKLTRLPKETYENVQTEENFGITREWLSNAKKVWEDDFDWKKQEDRINSLPAFTASIKNSDGKEYTIHFTALFSQRSEAIPIILSHGWPGCFLEFLPMLEMVQKRFKADELPYHLIVPSLPGFAFSSPPPLDREFGTNDIAFLFNGLMEGLGFKEYIAQGGDIGSRVTYALAKYHERCKILHVNFRHLTAPPEGTPEFEAKKNKPLDPDDVIEALQQFGYALEHSTRPSTNGFTVGSNPISLLSWIGEKYQEWSDVSPSLETILTFTSLYWFTDTFPSSIYTYRYNMGVRRHIEGAEAGYMSKPVGYSLFPRELAPTPIHWVGATCNLVWSKKHKDGGHFAALEKPEELFEDIEDFIKAAWNV